jgi:hypothetical protein
MRERKGDGIKREGVGRLGRKDGERMETSLDGTNQYALGGDGYAERSAKRWIEIVRHSSIKKE